MAIGGNVGEQDFGSRFNGGKVELLIHALDCFWFLTAKVFRKGG
jgi:hypothetical protein